MQFKSLHAGWPGELNTGHLSVPRGSLSVLDSSDAVTTVPGAARASPLPCPALGVLGWGQEPQETSPWATSQAKGSALYSFLKALVAPPSRIGGLCPQLPEGNGNAVPVTQRAPQAHWTVHQGQQKPGCPLRHGPEATDL